LAAVIGAAPLPRTEVTKKVWEYIKKHNLQDAANKRNINADAKLKPIFGKATGHHVRADQAGQRATELIQLVARLH
jgi:chromatin remodeling complex protein RSC6